MPDRNLFDTPEYTERFRKLQQYRRQARIAQSENRTDMAIDEDYYDSIQMTPEDLLILSQRGQAPEVYNVVKHIVNSIIGTEKAMRWDYNILPRKKSDALAAKSKSKLFKYIMDINRGEFERSKSFIETVSAGLGWLELGVRSTGELIIRSERWRNIWYDHLHSRIDGSDMRWVCREKWVDADIAQAMFPQFSKDLEIMVDNVSSLYPYRPDEMGVTDNASEFDLEDLDFLSGGSFDWSRERVKLIEMEYRIPANVKIMNMRDEDTPYGTLDGAIYRPEEPDHKYLVQGGYFTTTDAYRMTVRRAIWTGKLMMQDILSPYNHNRFSFIPIFCYIRKRDNMPYGIIRDLRDPQSSFNSKKMKARFLMAAKQVWIEKGAVDDFAQFHSEMQRPDGIGIVNEGKMGAIKQVETQVLAKEHLEAAHEDERFMYSIAAVTADAVWQSRKDMSGKALGIQQQQSQIGQGVIFDNYAYSFQCVGEIILSNMEQFIDQKKEFRITGDRQKDEFVTVNARKDDGTVDMDSSITAAKADFIIGKRDYRESIRQVMVEQLVGLIEILGKVKPDDAVALIDLVVDLMDDLPNKDEAVARIRKINGQHTPEDEMTDEEKQQIKQTTEQMAQEQAMMKQLQQALISMKLAESKSKVQKDMAEVLLKKLDAFLKAIEVAGNIGLSPQLVVAADQLIAEAIGAGSNGGQGQEQPQQQQIIAGTQGGI